ncbi:MAG TPA: DNA (cytosine-5-)-methyltransferase [Spirochaetia bacterium]|nr:DNA (cytosine-5-)-methyltransferase [Spirochaetia bacterium]
MNSKNKAHWIKIERLKRSISQAKLAKLLKIKQVDLSEWETGKVEIDPANSDKINRLLSQYDKLKEPERNSLIDRRSYKQERYDVPTELKKTKKTDQNKSNYKTNEALLISFAKKFSNSSKPKGIALFAGCGGLSLGFHRAGFDILGFVELEKEYRETYGENFKNTECLGSDIRNVSNEDVQKWKKHFGEIDVLFGGPPCQGFSLAGKRDRFDPRNQLYLEFVRVASKLNPRMIVLENVRLLTSMKTINDGYVADDIVQRFNDIGYEVKYKVLNAQDYGVPQSRSRVIFIGVRKDLNKNEITFPDQTHGVNHNSLFPLKPLITFRDATSDLESLESGEKSDKDPLHFAISHPQHVIEMLKMTPEGKSAHENSDPAHRPKSGYNTTYKRIKWDEPSSTIGTTFSMISGSRNVHPTNTRSLTIREATRCQTFPDEFKFLGNWGTIRTMIGNAVPPLLGEAIANHIKKKYLDDKSN